MISQEQPGSLLPKNSGAATSKTDLHVDKSETVMKGTCSTLPVDNLGSSNWMTIPEGQLDQSSTASQQRRENSVLITSDNDVSAKYTHNADFNGIHIQTELENLHLVDEKQDSESDDELEQFVFQPKSNTQRNFKF